jgi:cytoskeletal protein CcmA (bactofilin family)
MAIWKDSNANRQAPAPAPEAPDHNRMDLSSRVEAAPAQSPAARAQSDRARTESLIAADIMIEGKIEGSGSVRIAGKFKGDVNVQGDLTIEAGAKLTGSVRADKVSISGELEGNIEAASQVNLLASGVVVGDIKAGSLTVAAGARMRGNTEFGWDETKAAIAKSAKPYANGVETVGNA